MLNFCEGQAFNNDHSGTLRLGVLRICIQDKTVKPDFQEILTKMALKRNLRRSIIRNPVNAQLLTLKTREMMAKKIVGQVWRCGYNPRRFLTLKKLVA